MTYQFKNEQERYRADLELFAVRLTAAIFVAPSVLFVAMVALATIVPVVVVVPGACAVASFYAAGFAFYWGNGAWLFPLLRVGIGWAGIAGLWAYLPPGEAISRVF